MHDLAKNRAAALGCALAIIDVNLGPGAPNGVDAHAWLRGERFKGRTVFLTGHASTDPGVVAALRLGDAEVITKPIDLEGLGALVKGLES